MKRSVIMAAVPLMLSCAPAGGPVSVDRDLPEGIDPSRDRYLAETFLDIPSSGPVLEAGCNIFADKDRETRDAFMRVRTRVIHGAGRLRVTGDMSREAFHLAAAPIRHFRLDLGDLVPDLGIGIISSGRRFTYPFSPKHPLYRPRGIRGWTGFYGSFIRGAAIRAGAGPVGLTLLYGRTCVHGGDGVEFLDGRKASGLRLHTGGGGIKVGLTVIDAGSRSGERISGVDLTIASRGRVCMLEAASVPSRGVSTAWGLTIGGRRIDCGILGWSVPAGAEGYLASIPGLSTATGRSRSGSSIVLNGRFPGRTHVSAWGELRHSSNGEDRALDRAVRFEAGIRWKKGAARCSWSLREKESESLVPFPPREDIDTDISRGLAISVSCRPASSMAMVMELKRPGGGSGEGLMYSSRASMAFSRLHTRLSVSAAVYRSYRGNARFSLYEPSGGGKYPWKALYGSGTRLTLGLDTGSGGIRASLWLLWKREGLSEATMCLTVAI